MNLYLAKCKRKNIDQKPDYDHIFKYSNGWPILFDTENEALQYATERCSLPEFSMYGPACELANVSRYRSLKGAACMGVTEIDHKNDCPAIDGFGCKCGDVSA